MYNKEREFDILVVEDDSPVQKIAIDIIEEAGYTAYGVSLGMDAIEAAKSYSPRLISLDLFLPDIDGNKVLELLRKDDELREIPVIVLSAYPQALRKTSGVVQVKAVIAKPFDIFEYLDAIREHILPAQR